jgi:hypothetical protein
MVGAGGTHRCELDLDMHLVAKPLGMKQRGNQPAFGEQGDDSGQKGWIGIAENAE